MTEASPYLMFDRAAWASLRGGTPMTLTPNDVAELSGINEALSMTEVEEVYLPLSRLVNLHVAAVGQLHRVSSQFLNTSAPKVPYVVAIGGSVSVGKSTTARVLSTLLARAPDHPRVDLVTTDGFLFPNAELDARGLMQRKGFPESYDRGRLIQFLCDLKSGLSPLSVPIYSHSVYDIVADEHQVVDRPDIVILEGLNVLQSGSEQTVFVSDFVDFSIYVDASEADLQTWFLDRFRKLREAAFDDPTLFFHRFSIMPEEEAMAMATSVWEQINLANLRENILPTRERARLILGKGASHVVESVMLRRL
ncbi:MAG TPA: type I pantothenate kinase [Thermoanaerobaculia bacterium]|jgi:type I pantothenate kinase|nr:type I pantothenate kinase [Thermoanaerobaculia bacterium]